MNVMIACSPQALNKNTGVAAPVFLFVLNCLLLPIQPLANVIRHNTCYDREYKCDDNFPRHRYHLLPVNSRKAQTATYPLSWQFNTKHGLSQDELAM